MDKPNCFLPDYQISTNFNDTVVNFSNKTASSDRVGYQLIDFNIPNIWKENMGSGLVIAVIDTGIQADHIDLASNIIKGKSFIDSEGTVSDQNGHGTHVSGIVSAQRNNMGVVGVAPESKILPIKVLDKDGRGSLEALAEAISFATDEGVDVINVSLGGTFNFKSVRNAILKAYKKNIPVICAAGNNGDLGKIMFPAYYPETISIGAIDEERVRTEWSQTGTNLDFMAPGDSIVSTFPTNQYAAMSGTSMASPWVAGVVALMIAKHRKFGGQTPIEGVEDIREHLKKTALDIYKVGKDKKTGFGIISVSDTINTILKENKENDKKINEENNFKEKINKIQLFLDAANEINSKNNKIKEDIDKIDNKINKYNLYLDEIKNIIDKI